MADRSTQTSLLKSIGGLGGDRVTGVSTISGVLFMAIHANEETTVLGDTVGNINNIEDMVIAAGDTILGEWTVVHTEGDCIIYKG